MDCVPQCVWGVFEDGRKLCADTLRALGDGIRDYAVYKGDCPEEPAALTPGGGCIGEVLASVFVTLLCSIGICGGLAVWWIHRDRQQELEPQFDPIEGFENPHYRYQIADPIPVGDDDAG
ncbi:unnamed protein product, partial [Allacma fusca]